MKATTDIPALLGGDSQEPLFDHSAGAVNTRALRSAYHGANCVFSSPEKRVKGEREGYRREVEAWEATFARFRTPENEDEMREELREFQAWDMGKRAECWHAHGRTANPWATGRSNFNYARNSKKWDAEDNKRKKYWEARQKYWNRLVRKWNPNITPPISSEHPLDAIEELDAKLARHKAAHEAMKAANRIIRSEKLDDAEKVTKIAALDGFDEGKARKLLEPDYMGKQGFRPYVFSNSSATMRRMKERIERLKAEREHRDATPDEYEVCGVRVIENDDAGRLQIDFGYKPSADVRKELKARGFRFSRRQGNVWQRLLNHNARHDAEVILEKCEREGRLE